MTFTESHLSRGAAQPVVEQHVGVLARGHLVGSAANPAAAALMPALHATIARHEAERMPSRPAWATCITSCSMLRSHNELIIGHMLILVVNLPNC
jgi:hypothetical protein